MVARDNTGTAVDSLGGDRIQANLTLHEAPFDPSDSLATADTPAAENSLSMEGFSLRSVGHHPANNEKEAGL